MCEICNRKTRAVICNPCKRTKVMIESFGCYLDETPRCRICPFYPVCKKWDKLAEEEKI